MHSSNEMTLAVAALNIYGCQNIYILQKSLKLT